MATQPHKHRCSRQNKLDMQALTLSIHRNRSYQKLSQNGSFSSLKPRLVNYENDISVYGLLNIIGLK